MFERIPEKEIMDDEEQAAAYSNADFSEPHNLFVDLALKFLALQNNASVLDIGIGDADIAIRLVKKLPSISVTGFDGSLAMLDNARKKIQKEGLSTKILYRHDLIKNKPFGKTKFDAIISNSVLHHVEKPNLFWSFMKNKMHKKSKFFVMDLLRPESIREAESLIGKYAHNETKQLKRDFYNSLLAAYTLDEVKGQLKKNHFLKCHVDQITDRHFVVFGDMFA